MKMKQRKLRRKAKFFKKIMRKNIKETVSDRGLDKEKEEEIRKQLSDRVLETAKKQRLRVAKTPRLK